MWQYNHNYQTELYHYGVPGMKWGVRNFKQEARQEYKRRKTAAKNDDEIAKAKADYKTRVKNFKEDVKLGGPVRRVKLDPKTGTISGVSKNLYDSRGNKISSEYAQKIETAAKTRQRNRTIARGVGTAASILASIGAATVFQIMQNR